MPNKEPKKKKTKSSKKGKKTWRKVSDNALLAHIALAILIIL